MRKPAYTKEELQSAISQFHSVAEMLRHFGRNLNSGNYQTIESYALRYNLVLPKKRGGDTTAATKFITRPLNEVLIKDSTYTNTANLKARLLREKLLINRCAVDGQEPSWNGLPLVLILDHINGDRSDNRLENLRLLCPNCNTQQATFCRGKRGVT